ncbi:MAG TPA: hypothetical protein VE641_10515 [Chthoniobacterales bacterium]|jgi:hypothetical protein|nr:hypothetical protein [Chthoniobacterales bacterium]
MQGTTANRTETKDLTTTQVADICGNNSDRIIMVCQEIGATKPTGTRNPSWYQAAEAIARSFRGVERAEYLLKQIAAD